MLYNSQVLHHTVCIRTFTYCMCVWYRAPIHCTVSSLAVLKGGLHQCGDTFCLPSEVCQLYQDLSSSQYRFQCIETQGMQWLYVFKSTFTSLPFPSFCVPHALCTISTCALIQLLWSSTGMDFCNDYSPCVNGLCKNNTCQCNNSRVSGRFCEAIQLGEHVHACVCLTQ